MIRTVQHDRRSSYRHKGKATVVVQRDRDISDPGVSGRLGDVSTCGVGLLLPTPPEVGDFVTLEMESSLQRVKVRLRARVRRVQTERDGGAWVACSLLTKLTERQVWGLRRGPMET